MKLFAKQVTVFQLLTTCLIFFLGTEVVVLVMQNRGLKNKISQLTDRTSEILKPGDRTEDIIVNPLEGNEMELKISDSTKQNLVFVFSTACPHCEKNVIVWNDIVRNNIDKCSFVGISTSSVDETKKFAAIKNITFWTVSVANDTSFRRKFKVVAVPLTILFTRQGKVEKVWLGELNSDQTKEIKQLIDANAASF